MDFNEEGMGDGIRFQLLPHLEYFRFSSLEETRFCLSADRTSLSPFLGQTSWMLFKLTVVGFTNLLSQREPSNFLYYYHAFRDEFLG